MSRPKFLQHGKIINAKNIIEIGDWIKYTGDKLEDVDTRPYSCPFHYEKTPSFVVKDGIFYCFSCGLLGDYDKYIYILEHPEETEIYAKLCVEGRYKHKYV